MCVCVCVCTHMCVIIGFPNNSKNYPHIRIHQKRFSLHQIPVANANSKHDYETASDVDVMNYDILYFGDNVYNMA